MIFLTIGAQFHRKLANGCFRRVPLLGLLFGTLLLAAGCGSRDPNASDEVPTIVEGECALQDEQDVPNYLSSIGCRKDYDALASEPIDSSIPGAVSAKVILDREDDNRLYYQNSKKYALHFDFVTENIDNPPTIQTFNESVYFSEDRRFVVGSVSYYEASDVWTLELAPYDNASASLIELLYGAVKDSAYFGPALYLRPTSDDIAKRTEELSSEVRVITSDELYAGIDYQPLSLGTAVGRLRFVKAADLENTFLDFQDIVVLDNVPNDISTVLGIITEEFQTPLSHINVLSENRGTPNMGLRNATKNDQLRALEGKWAKLEVGAFDWSIEEATEQEASDFWEQVRPEPVQAPRVDDSITELTDITEVVPNAPVDTTLKDAIKAAIPAFGGKASHYSVLTQIDGVPIQDAFVVPMHYYLQFLQENGFDTEIDTMLADDDFVNDPATRNQRLAELRDAMMVAPVNADFESLLRAKIDQKFPGLTHVRFRSSTNGEDLDGFTGAGLYTSKTGDPFDGDDLLDAVREVWSSVWYFRAFEERRYRSIGPTDVCMALLVTPSFDGELANGVALTANPFDTSAEPVPAFYINAQVDEESVVQPDPGVTTEQFIYYYAMPGQPINYLSTSSLVDEGEHVLTARQAHDLATALELIHNRFSFAYGPGAGNTGWYAMDTEFKLDDVTDSGGEPQIYLKQARPHPGRGSTE